MSSLVRTLLGKPGYRNIVPLKGASDADNYLQNPVIVKMTTERRTELVAIRPINVDMSNAYIAGMNIATGEDAQLPILGLINGEVTGTTCEYLGRLDQLDAAVQAVYREHLSREQRLRVDRALAQG